MTYRQKKLNRFLRGFAIAMGILLIGCGFLVYKVDEAFAVSETVIRDLTIPGEDARILLVKRSGNATVGFSYSVRVVNHGRTWDLLLDDKVSDLAEIKIAWTTRALEVRLPKDTRIFRQATEVRVGDRRVPFKVLMTS